MNMKEGKNLMSFNIFQFIKGYIRIKISEKNPKTDISKFLNNLSKNDIIIWNISKINNNFYINTNIKNYLKIYKLSQKYNVKLKIYHRYGLPFIINKYKKRTGIVIGLAIFFVFLALMSQFIWTIEVHGNKKIDSMELIKFVSQKNIKPGKYRKNIDVKLIEQETLLHFQDISWISINILGSKACIEINEKTPPPPTLKTQTPCNIVASKPGTIKHVEAYCGQNLVQQGDFVTKNQIVVSGILQDKSLKNTVVSARAKVIAHTEEIFSYSQPLDYKKNSYQTISTNLYLELFGTQIPINFSKKTDGEIRKSYSTIHPKLLNISLPFCITQCQNQKPVSTSVRLCESQAKKQILKKINKNESIMKNNNMTIISKTILEQGLQNNNYIIKIKYITEQDIAKPQEIIIN